MSAPNSKKKAQDSNEETSRKGNVGQTTSKIITMMANQLDRINSNQSDAIFTMFSVIQTLESFRFRVKWNVLHTWPLFASVTIEPAQFFCSTNLLKNGANSKLHGDHVKGMCPSRFAIRKNNLQWFVRKGRKWSKNRSIWLHGERKSKSI